MHLSQKKLAAKVLKCGVSRVRVLDQKAVAEALTREDIRSLVKRGSIQKLPKVGNSRVRAKKLLKQKKKGRRIGRGSRKGTKKTSETKKQKWIKIARPVRKLLKELKDQNRIDHKHYRDLYLKIKGGFFRNKKHLLFYLKEKEMLKKFEKPKGKL